MSDQSDSTIRSAHWLAELADHSGVDLDLRPDPEPAELVSAWNAIADATDLSQDELVDRVAAHFHLDKAELDQADGRALKLIPAEVARRYGVFPLSATDGEVAVATADPLNRRAQDDLEALSGRSVRFLVGRPDLILGAIDRFYAPDQFLENVVSNLVSGTRPDSLRLIREQAVESAASFDLESPPLVKLSRLILDQFSNEATTELHVEPERDGGRVRLRTGGELHHFMHLPLVAMARVIFRMKSLAGLDLAERVKPQHGVIRVASNGQEKELFVVTSPGINGERLSILGEEPDYEAYFEHVQQAVELAKAAPVMGRVLVVDDDASARLLMRSVLEKQGFEVLEADDGPPALALLDEYGDVSLVMLDLNMPQLHGREVLARIRGSIGTAGLPVVVLTGIEDPRVEIELLKAGADDYLRKPIDPQRLAVRVQAVLRRAGSYEAWPEGL
jgi:CheY-like chemotaxis protein